MRSNRFVSAEIATTFRLLSPIRRRAQCEKQLKFQIGVRSVSVSFSVSLFRHTFGFVRAWSRDGNRAALGMPFADANADRGRAVQRTLSHSSRRASNAIADKPKVTQLNEAKNNYAIADLQTITNPLGIAAVGRGKKRSECERKEAGGGRAAFAKSSNFVSKQMPRRERRRAEVHCARPSRASQTKSGDGNNANASCSAFRNLYYASNYFI